MKFREFIGIDVSKSHIDVFLYTEGIHAKFNNDEPGFQKMMVWIGQYTKCASQEALFARVGGPI